VANQTIDPVAFAAQNNDIANEITNSLDRLGRAPMQAILQMAAFRISNLGAPIAQNDAARLADVGAYLPPGAIQDFALNTAPLGWLECDGTAYLISTYSALAAALGTLGTDGVSFGQTGVPASGYFHVPDLRGTTRRTWDHGKGLDPARVFASYQADTFASHTHTEQPHTHTITDPGHYHTVTPSGVTFNAQPGSTAAEQPGGGITGTATTGITIANATATINATGSAETVGKNYAVLTCIRT
jgi:microcystin-dependent protein